MISLMNPWRNKNLFSEYRSKMSQSYQQQPGAASSSSTGTPSVSSGVPFDLSLKWVNRMVENSQFSSLPAIDSECDSVQEWREFGQKSLHLVYDILMDRQAS